MDDDDSVDVVIKTPLTTDEYILKTFTEEARVLNCLAHPNIVQLIGVCTLKKAIILEYINTGDVHNWLKSKRVGEVNLKQRVDIVLQSALGMQYLHGCEPPIVHRDLKTLNILLNTTIDEQTGTNRLVVKICDFGLARNSKSPAGGISTQHKDMGTPAYQSPEQWRDDEEERLTEKTDVYSFGSILLEVLTDRIPWYGEKSKYAIYQHVVVEKRSPPVHTPLGGFAIPRQVAHVDTLVPSMGGADRPPSGDTENIERGLRSTRSATIRREKKMEHKFQMSYCCHTIHSTDFWTAANERFTSSNQVLTPLPQTQFDPICFSTFQRPNFETFFLFY